MNRKTFVLLIAIIFLSFTTQGQTNNHLTNEQKEWLAKANRHEKDGWVYIHIEGKPLERGFQHGYLLAKQMSFVARWGSA
jgi:hypothetical protein